MKLDVETLEAAAQMLERTAGNSLYQAAWRAAAKKIRRMKILNDGGQQISSLSHSNSGGVSPAVKAGA